MRRACHGGADPSLQLSRGSAPRGVPNRTNLRPLWPKALRTEIDGRLREYLTVGGFPEAQGVPLRDRINLLRTYVDVAILRDVIERYGISNPLPLRWLQRHLLASPAAPFSVQKFYDFCCGSQGISVGKDTLHTFLGHLEDTLSSGFVSLHTASERQRMVNLRKVYPVDPGLILVYERTGRLNLGHALETAVLIELERRGYEVSYVRTREGLEVDFLARSPGGPLDAPSGVRRHLRCRHPGTRSACTACPRPLNIRMQHLC